MPDVTADPIQSPGRSISLKEVRRAWDNDDEKNRRLDTKELLAIYHNQWRPLLLEKINDLFLEQNAERLRPRADTSINLLKWATDEIAAIYSQPSNRTIDGTSEGLEPYLNQGTIDMSLDAACKMTHLCREAAIRPLTHNGKVVIDILTPDRFSIIPHPKDPSLIDAIIVELPKTATARYSVWTTEDHYLLGHDWRVIEVPDNPENTNPYGVIPYVVTHANYPATGFWNVQDAFGLRDATYNAGVQMSDHAHLRHLQSHKQLVIHGTQDEAVGRLASDPSSAILIKNPAAGAQVLDMRADLKGHLESMMMGFNPVLMMHGLMADTVRGNTDSSSGYALTIKMHRQATMWSRLRVLWRIWERRLFEVARIVLATPSKGESSIALPDGLLDLEYPEIGPSSDPQEKAALAKALQETGWSRAATAREVYGKSDEWIAANEEELAAESMLDSPISIPPMVGRVSPPPTMEDDAGEALEDDDEEVAEP